ncbi:hypothetical protein [Segniliparus rugosus]|uniref:Uncharacterized protein n=1 Tax=Segniliparus rugosus (strain ATCC BAA-974 / DSM 45345 / CCUG 50838 / CIP 108380 / JCM 13579 / CDC 945) TaxID=679197 RepID=E5XMZ9_SEGRC|nr:hypothetical protein [Segniliparus rugosus]EFV14257.2 hypothetical protein HMPREF9336_00869 [Segniliparus rugosus ATCC BAA-974]
MNLTMRTIAKATSAAAFGMFALAPGLASMASAGPAHESVGFVPVGDSSSTGSGDSHGRNSTQLPQPQNGNNNAPVHILAPGGQR